MEAAIRYYSTNREAPPVGFPEALLRGQAPDRGLYLPERLPTLSTSVWEDSSDRPYADVAFEVLRPFTRGFLADQALQVLCHQSYDFDVPLEQVTQRRFVMRLDQGPTASFKDFAARMMARWMGALGSDGDRGGSRDRGRASQGLIVLTATSGDTGSAVAHAFQGVAGVRSVVLFPLDEVSPRQRRQMTTLGGHTTCLAVRGKFDDCQALVKRAFGDPDLADLRLTSANSINVGRLLPQAVYYVFAYARLAHRGGGEPMMFSVPSGNFGNMMGAVLAARMGVPIRRLVVATNANDEFPEFLRTGVYRKITPSRVCLSNAMNVGHPSNLARLVDLFGGRMDETGTVRTPPDLDAMREQIHAVAIDDETTRMTIMDAHRRHGILLEPHGAVGWAGLEHFVQAYPEEADCLAVCVETAHPAKFPEEIRSILGIEPQAPPSLSGLEHRPERYETISANYDTFRAFLQASGASPTAHNGVVPP